MSMRISKSEQERRFATAGRGASLVVARCARPADAIRRSCCCAILALAFAMTHARAQGVAPKGEEPVVDLPLYEVRGDRVLPPPESWRYVRVPDVEIVINGNAILVQGVEVLSNLSRKNTEVFVHELQLRQVASAYFWPSLATARVAQPPPVIVIDRTDDPMMTAQDWPMIEWSGIEMERAGEVVQSTFSSFDETDDWNLRGAVRGFGGSSDFWSGGDYSNSGSPSADGGIWSDIGNTGVWRDTGRELLRLNSRLGRGDTRATPLPRGAVEVRNVDGVATIRVRAGSKAAHEERIASEVNASLLTLSLERMSPPPRKWLQVGLRWLISTMEVSRLEMKMGGRHIWLPQGGRPASLMSVLNEIPDATSSPNASEFTAIAFVQYCLMVDGGRHAKAFGEFVARAGDGPVTEEMLKECFGMGFARMDRALLRYVTDTIAYRENGLRGKFPPMLDAPVREATQSEVARLQAEMYFAGNAPKPALDVLRVAYWRGGRDIALLAALAGAEARAGDLTRAKKLLTRIKAEAKQPLRMTLAEARIRYRETRESSEWSGQFAQAETVEILTLLAKAAGQTARPGEEACELFARVVNESEGEPDGMIVDFLKRAGRLYPNNKIIGEAADRSGGLHPPDEAGIFPK